MLAARGIKHVLSCAGRTAHQRHRRLLITGERGGTVRTVVVHQQAECVLARYAAAGMKDAPVTRR